MTNGKTILGAIGGIIMGFVFCWLGGLELQDSLWLARDGVQTTAVVQEAYERSSGLGTTYYLEIKYTIPERLKVSTRVEVDKDTFHDGANNRSINVFYHPLGLTNVQAGEKVRMKWSTLAFGIATLGVVGFLSYTRLQPRNVARVNKVLKEPKGSAQT